MDEGRKKEITELANKIVGDLRSSEPNPSKPTLTDAQVEETAEKINQSLIQSGMSLEERRELVSAMQAKFTKKRPDFVNSSSGPLKLDLTDENIRSIEKALNSLEETVVIRSSTTGKEMEMTGSELAQRLRDSNMTKKEKAETVKAIHDALQGGAAKKRRELTEHKMTVAAWDLFQEGYACRKHVGQKEHRAFAEKVMKLTEVKPGDTDEVMNRKIFPLLLLVMDVVGEKSPSVADDTAVKLLPFLVGSVCWAQEGFPQFDLTPDFFHSLAATDFGDAGDDAGVNLPFHAQAFKLPPNEILAGARAIFVHEFGTDSEEDPMSAEVIVGVGKRRIALLFDTPNEKDSLCVTSSWEADDPIKDAVAETGEAMKKMFEKDGKLEQKRKEYQELVNLARRIVLNTLIYINASGGTPEPGAKKLGADVPVERDHKELPRFRVGRPIKLGPTLKKYLYTRSPSSEVRELMHRFMVRGHWRNQAHGPRLQLRKRMWIEPYWKGPEDITEALSRTYEVE